MLRQGRDNFGGVMKRVPSGESSASLSGPQTHLTLLARTQDDASVCRDFLLEETRKVSAFRGQTLVIRSGESQRDPIRVEFSETRPVSRERIILPEALFETLDRSALRQLEIADSLAAAGLRTRTAVLLYGPPGTGKTLLTRYMVASCKGLTTILLHGFTRGLVREAFRIARYCEPSIVVIEDVDLIALARHKRSGGTSSLHELMDELDGLVPESRTIVVMTTNRPDVLEPALASRPGRVSQAIEVPLPDAESRLRILKLFTSRMDISQVDLNQWVSRTSGASPAFLEELIRRAATFALGTSETSKKRETIRLTNAELESAIREILDSGGLLTRRLLGFDATNGNPA
jgi:SpoVK/Ycf46/Vps4 family AAA+-type ATPase